MSACVCYNLPNWCVSVPGLGLRTHWNMARRMWQNAICIINQWAIMTIPSTRHAEHRSTMRLKTNHPMAWSWDYNVSALFLTSNDCVFSCSIFLHTNRATLVHATMNMIEMRVSCLWWPIADIIWRQSPKIFNTITSSISSKERELDW